MDERHERDQYFFDAQTIEHLASFVSGFKNPCCLCAPLLGKTLAERGVRVRVLDIDERFASVSGFTSYDLYRPRWLGEEFDLILCDPPFHAVSLSQLFAAIRTLARNDYGQPLLVSYLRRRATNLLGTFWRFGLAPTGYFPRYLTVEPCERNDVEFFGNLSAEAMRCLVGD